MLLLNVWKWVCGGQASTMPAVDHAVSLHVSCGQGLELASKFGNLKSFIQSTEARVIESLLDIVICAGWLASFSLQVPVGQCQVCSTGADQCGYNTDCRFISTQSLNAQKFWNVSSCCLDRSMDVQHIIQKSLFSCSL